MGKEHEHKLLIRSIPSVYLTDPASIRQGYLGRSSLASTRLRIKDEAAFVTIKGNREGISRTEFEYEVPLSDAITIMDSLILPINQINKTRYHYEFSGFFFEIDVFAGFNKGLIIAEVEVSEPGIQITIPDDWNCVDVTQEVRFYNEYLAEHPFTKWLDMPECKILTA